MTTVSRRAFVTASSAAVIAAGAPGAVRLAGAVPASRDGAGEADLPASFPTHDPDVVRLLVLKCHVDYDAVHALVTPRPELAKAAWDWGFGDWESALGAASHMGRRDIAELLIEHGARPNLFTYAMMDQVDVVRAVCVANPGAQRQRGPHGLTLMQHATNGKAARVTEYLDTLGDADVGQVAQELTETDGAAYVGEYRPEGVAGTRFRITYHQRRKGLTFQRDDRQGRALLRSGPHEFNPGGASSVRVTFDVRGGRAETMQVTDGGLVVRATRIG